MNPANPMEDPFEKARREFFGNIKTSAPPSASPAEYLEPQNELKVNGPFSDAPGLIEVTAQ